MFEKLFAERGLSFDRLRVLIEVHDAGSIAQAAPGDPIRQSQYSRQLREIAEFFGCEVATRRGKILKLTPQGVRLAELTRAHLRSLEDFRAECRAEAVDYTIAAGDSLIQWLVVPRLGALLESTPGVRFATSNLRTNDVVQQLGEGRVDFGVIRKDALVAGLKSADLGTLTYCVVVPKRLAGRAKLTLKDVFAKVPLAAQKADGQFTQRLREIARSCGVELQPALACESFPQALAAVRSGRFAAVVPAIATADLQAGTFVEIVSAELQNLRRDLALAWNPRSIRVRPAAGKLAERLWKVLRLSESLSHS
jgi:DNA-binding transcriptional LysR family regulator